MKVKLIAAVASNGVIGIDNRLPWHLPEDLAFFKASTMGKPIVMGRKTWDSIGRPLPGRLNVVISRNADWQPAPDAQGNARMVCRVPSPLPAEPPTRVACAGGLSEALAWLRNNPQAVGGTEGLEEASVFLIGGSNLYQQAMAQNLVDELVLTEIHQDFAGDAHFPAWERSRFREVERTPNAANNTRPWSFDFVRYQRID